jgi:Family of unknown function (DUF6541)
MGEITWGTATATLAALFVFLLPGWAVLSLLLPPERFAPERRPDAAAWLILAAGLTLALVPVGLLFVYMVGLKVGTGVALAGLALSAAVILWRRGPAWRASWRQSSWPKRLGPLAPFGMLCDHLDIPLVALVLVAALVLGVRLWVVRGINIGFWNDSYHHTMIAQLMLDNGGLFQSWEPYAPLRTLTYHFGFHADVALFQWASGWLTGNPTPRTVVLVGQFLNVLAALALYPLTVRLCTGNRWAGVFAVLVAGLLSPMPMYYVNWGRYTQLAGQAILPLALWFTLEAVEEERWDWRRLVLATVMLAGLALTHYKVAVFAVAFLVPYLGLWTYRRWARRKEGHSQAYTYLEPVARLALIGIAGLALAMPWLLHLGQGFWPSIANGFIQGQVPASFVAEHNAVYNLKEYMPYPLLVLAGLGALWSIWRRQPVSLVVPWAGLVFLLTNPHLLGLPGTGLMTNFAIAIAMYLPVAMLVGYLGGEVVGLLSRWGQDKGGLRSTRPVGWAALVVILIIGLVGAQDRAAALNPALQLVTPADEQAMAWIRDNTPASARFLVNSSFGYGDSVTIGSDAGWWIPLLTGRANTAPPMTYGTEASFVSDYLTRVNDLLYAVQSSAIDDPATAQLLRQNGITHVYVGEKGGDLLDVERLRASPLYRLIYQQGQVYIFEIVPDPK